MKVMIVLAAVAVSCVSAGGLHGYAGPALGLGLGAPVALAGPAYASSGSSQQFRAEDNYGNYQFGYDEAHATGATGRREERAGDIVRGSYNLADADGRRRTVNYVADAAGFHASVHTNEPGVDPARDPADVLINKEGVAIAPAPVVAAPAPLALPAPLPIAAPAPVPAAPVFHAPAFAAKTIAAPLAAPLPIAAPAPVFDAPIIEAPAPRAFSYSFGNSHPSFAVAAPAPLGLPAPLPAPIAGPAPIFQHGIKY